MDEKKFWSKVNKLPGVDSCWIWTGGTDGNGYGKFRPDPKKESKWKKAHRYAWELRFGAIPAGKLIRHQCDNPPCVRWSHLLKGTHADNHRDMVERSRQARGEKHGTAILTERKVRLILAMTTMAMRKVDISRILGIKYQTVDGITAGRTWKYLQ